MLWGQGGFKLGTCHGRRAVQKTSHLVWWGRAHFIWALGVLGSFRSHQPMQTRPLVSPPASSFLPPFHCPFFIKLPVVVEKDPGKSCAWGSLTILTWCLILSLEWVTATTLASFREERVRKGTWKKERKLSPCGGGKQSKTNLSHYCIPWWYGLISV